MARYDELPVFKATYDLLLRVYEISQHWRRDLRYTIGEKIKEDITELLLLVYQANTTTDKLLILRRCKVLLVRVRIQIRVVKDLKSMSIKQYSAVAEIEENISKQLSGWEKSEKRKGEQ